MLIDQQMFMTAECIGDEYRVYIKGRLVAAFNSPDAFMSGVRLLSTLDPANDGPEVDIICREAQIKTEDFMNRKAYENQVSRWKI